MVGCSRSLGYGPGSLSLYPCHCCVDDAPSASSIHSRAGLACVRELALGLAPGDSLSSLFCSLRLFCCYAAHGAAFSPTRQSAQAVAEIRYLSNAECGMRNVECGMWN